MAALKLARVLAVHPESNTIDVMLLEGTGAPVSSVPVLSGANTTNTGLCDNPVPTPVDFDNGAPLTKNRDMLAVIGEGPGFAVALGFVYPQVSQMLFQRENFRVERHASDVYRTVNADGDVELYHPSGTYVRIAQDPDHEDLTGKDYDAQWKIKNNTDKKPHLRVVIAQGGETKLDLHADPDGNLSLTAKGKLDAEVTGDVKIETQGKATVKSPSMVEVDAPNAHFTGNIAADGDIAAKGDVTSADGTISLTGHTHSGVTSGSEISGPPVPT